MDKTEVQGPAFAQNEANRQIGNDSGLYAAGRAAASQLRRYSEPFSLHITRPTNGFIVYRENGEALVFTDASRLLGYLREAIGLPMDEVSADAAGILVDEPEKGDPYHEPTPEPTPPSAYRPIGELLSDYAIAIQNGYPVAGIVRQIVERTK